MRMLVEALKKTKGQMLRDRPGFALCEKVVAHLTKSGLPSAGGKLPPKYQATTPMAQYEFTVWSDDLEKVKGAVDEILPGFESKERGGAYLWEKGDMSLRIAPHGRWIRGVVIEGGVW